MSPAAAFWTFQVFVLLWISTVITASIWWRKRRGRPIFPRPPEDARYFSTGGSAAFASNCLMVVVTPQDFWVTPTFPFNLGFLPEIYRLEVRSALSRVTHIEKRSGWLNIRLEFRQPNGSVRRLDLGVRSPDLFLEAVRAGIPAQSSPVSA